MCTILLSFPSPSHGSVFAGAWVGYGFAEEGDEVILRWDWAYASFTFYHSICRLTCLPHSPTRSPVVRPTRHRRCGQLDTFHNPVHL